jgi:hypothetical protein
MFATFACFVAFSQQSGTTLSAFSTESDTLDDACASMSRKAEAILQLS